MSLQKQVMEKMKEANIMTSQVHNRNDVNSCVEEYKGDLQNLDILEKDLVCIPVGWWVRKEDREYIVNKIKEFYN